MNKSRYVRSQAKGPKKRGDREGFVVLSDADEPNQINPMLIALWTIKLARRTGVRSFISRVQGQLPYDSAHDNTVFDAPILSRVASKNIRFMRGWQQYESCIKGFNGLGLIAEVVLTERNLFCSKSEEERRSEVIEFLQSRRKNGKLIFNQDQLADISPDEVKSISPTDISIWRGFSKRTIVCSTSSNMGISLHESLRYFQECQLKFKNQTFTVLNEDEGRLIIWCPDEKADFMNAEKAQKLRALTYEKPSLTELHTYINRRQRDPGALRDAMDLGGYFFPTNPQSREEMQNLLANAMKGFAEARRCTEESLLMDPKVTQTLDSMGCRYHDSQIVVTRGVESGLYGLMAAYLLMLNESIPG